MRTTLDLPDDVAETLRRESARRGGRAKAPMTQLISEAVRRTYGPRPARQKSKIVLHPGRSLVAMPRGVRISIEDVATALEDMR